MADKGLFPRLKRLFSTDVIIRNSGGNQITTIDTNTIQTSGEFNKMLFYAFNRIYTTSLYGHS